MFSKPAQLETAIRQRILPRLAGLSAKTKLEFGLAATYNEKGVNNIKVKEKISSAVARGCDVNSIDQAGLSALNVGILFDQPDIVKLMLSLGANPKLTIKSESGQLSGLDSLGFVEKLSSLKKPRKEIEALIRQKI